MFCLQVRTPTAVVSLMNFNLQDNNKEALDGSFYQLFMPSSLICFKELDYHWNLCCNWPVHLRFHYSGTSLPSLCVTLLNSERRSIPYSRIIICLLSHILFKPMHMHVYNGNLFQLSKWLGYCLLKRRVAHT